MHHGRIDWMILNLTRLLLAFRNDFWAVYRWKRRYGGLGLHEVRELRQLREENRKLKGIVADLTLDKHILQEVLSKKV